MAELATLGTGTSINFGTSGFSGRLLSIPNISGLERAGIDVTGIDVQPPAANTLGNARVLISQKVGPVELEVRFFFDPSLTPPLHGVKETITITFALPEGKTTPATWSCNGWMGTYNVEGITEDNPVEAVAAIRVDGGVLITAAT